MMKTFITLIILFFITGCADIAPAPVAMGTVPIYLTLKFPAQKGNRFQSPPLSNPPTGGSERRPPVGRSGYADIVAPKIIYAKNVDVTNRESKGGLRGFSEFSTQESDRFKSLRQPDLSRIVSVTLTVTGREMVPISQSTTLTADREAIFNLNVPAGPQRRFAVLALDSAENLLYQGEATSDLLLGTSPVIVVMMKEASTVTIVGDKSLPTVQLTVSSNSINETGTTTQKLVTATFSTGLDNINDTARTTHTLVTATLSAPSANVVTVHLAKSGTAIDDTDYTLEGAIVVPVGSLSASITLAALADPIAEPDETVVIDISAVEHGTEASVQQQTVTILGGIDPPAFNPIVSDMKRLRFSWSPVLGATGYQLFEDPGTGILTQVGLNIPAPTTNTHLDIPVHIYNWPNTRYAVRACVNALCSHFSNFQIAIDAMIGAIGYLKASNSAPDDQFGAAVALSRDGLTKAVGAPMKDGNDIGTQNDSGRIYLFVLKDDLWLPQSAVTALDLAAGDRFGSSVSLSDDGLKLIVGAPKQGPGDGAAYIFTRNTTNDNFSQEAILRALAPTGGDRFGSSVSISGDGTTVAIGAPLGNSANIQNTGVVHIFTFNGLDWVPQGAPLEASNPEAGDQFGVSVSMSRNGTTIAIGAPQGNTGILNTGTAYIFRFDGSNWIPQGAPLEASNPEAGDQFGASVSMSGDNTTVVVGAPNGNTHTPNTGAAYVFAFDGINWIPQEMPLQTLNIEQNDLFGDAVSLSNDGNMLVVGASGESSDATGVNGNQTNNNAPGAGAAYLFIRSGNTWLQQTYIKAGNTEAGDQFGSSVSLSGDGNTLAVGAPFEASNATGINGDQINNSAPGAGAAYLY